MGNLCSIFHSRFKNLIKIIPCARKAQLMDYILLGWQTSTYSLKNSDKKWFMKPHDEIVEDTQIKLSTLREYLKEFEKNGFIERRQARYNRKNAQGEYYVTMGGYINITDKFLDLIKLEPIKSSPTHQNTDDDSNLKIANGKTYSANIDNNQIIDPLKSGESYIRDLRSSFNNNINFRKTIDSVDKFTREKLIGQYKAIQRYVDTEIKEEIPEEIKKLVLGTFFNLTFEHKKQFSIPEQVTAEYLFSLINTQYCLPQVVDFKHRNHILAKTLRSNSWKTPKGFYKHFYLAQNFKDKQEIRQKQWQNTKEREIKQPNNFMLSPHDAALGRVEIQIMEKGCLIEELTQCIYQQNSDEQISIIQEQIKKLKSELHALYEEQWVLEKEIENEEGRVIKQCA